MTSTASDIEHFITPTDVPIYRLNVTEAFKGLTPKEKKYAHHFSQAAWWGSKICLGQTSTESPVIFSLFQRLFSLVSVDDLKSKVVPSLVSEDEFKHLLQYTASFYGNLGNYLSFGDSKFIPRIPKEKFQLVVESVQDSKLNEYWKQCGDIMYSLEEKLREMGIDGKGISTYYTPGITKAEIQLVQEFMTEKCMEAYNTRLFKIDNENYHLLIASAQPKESTTHKFKNITITIVYGDWSKNLTKVVQHLQEAIKYAANETQVNMIKKYIDHFATGNMEDHLDSQRFWVKDIGPVVETNIGFIESYRDPYGVRGEFEGLVAVVNKESSKKLSNLIDNAPLFISQLPWPKSFEKDRFIKPDFTSLEVLTFANSGVPAGINIPNYDLIRQNEGSKNVSLGNVLSARKREKVNFIKDSDQDVYNDYLIDSFEVQVAIHESFGHGSGKLFVKDPNGKLNFDPATTINPLTNKPVEPNQCYQPGENYDNIFTDLGSPMEECRAECSGIYLCHLESILDLFVPREKAENTYYVNWLSMCRAGLAALEFYSPNTKKWRQSHMQARHAIFQVLLRAGEGLLTLTKTEDDVLINLDRTKIKTVGVPAIGKFLTTLMVYKATADAKAARELFADYTGVSDEFLKTREIVLKKKKPRAVFVQSHTYIKDDEVVLQDFEDSPKGVIQSMITRFGIDNSDLNL
eukprot:gene2015-2482_t